MTKLKPIPIPIPIPRDLKPGDVIVLSNGQRREFHHYQGDGDAVIMGFLPGGLRRDGRAWAGLHDKAPFAVRIFRVASKPRKPKKDADAEWLRRLVKDGQTMGWDQFKRRLRKIAKRLEGSK